jgi:hypothetical protein
MPPSLALVLPWSRIRSNYQDYSEQILAQALCPIAGSDPWSPGAGGEVLRCADSWFCSDVEPLACLGIGPVRKPICGLHGIRERQYCSRDWPSSSVGRSFLGAPSASDSLPRRPCHDRSTAVLHRSRYEGRACPVTFIVAWRIVDECIAG